jgi:hypothetical protein
VTIDEVIENLKQAKASGKTNIVFAWWDSESFGRKDDEDWAYLCELADRKMDWSNAHDDLTSFFDYAKNIS